MTFIILAILVIDLIILYMLTKSYGKLRYDEGNLAGFGEAVVLIQKSLDDVFNQAVEREKARVNAPIVLDKSKIKRTPVAKKNKEKR